MESQHCFADGWACKEYLRKGQHSAQCAHCGHAEGCHKLASVEAFEALRKLKEEEARDADKGISHGACRHDIVLLAN